MTAFPAATLTAFEETKEVLIETRSPKGTVHKVIIWIVVVDGEPYVRSYYGAKGRWFRELFGRKEGAIHAGKRRIAVAPVRVRAAGINEKVSDAIRMKYRTSPASVKGMVASDAVATTARLEPA